jgi:hypothetical protein
MSIKGDGLPASDQIPHVPHRFDEARGLFADLFLRGDRGSIPLQTMLAAALVEVVPKLVSLYGGAGVAAILVKLANQVSMDDGDHAVTQ